MVANEDEFDLVLEIGLPRPPGEGDPPRLIRSLVLGQDGRRSLLGAAARLFAAGVDVDWAACHRPYGGRRISLPTYPFERERCWVEWPAPRPDSVGEGRSGLSDELFWSVGWREAPVAASGLEGRRGPERWVLFADQLGLGEALAAKLRSDGQRVVIVGQARQYRRLGADRFLLNPRDPAGYRELVAALVEEDGGSLGVLYGWGLTLVEPIAEGPEALGEVLESGAESFVFLARALASVGRTGPVELWVLASHGQAVVGAGEAVSPDAALVWGLARVFDREQAGIECRVCDLDLEREDPADSAAWVLAEIRRARASTHAEGSALYGDSVVAWRGGRRFLPVLEPARLEGGPRPLREGGVYLITGGRSGIGLEVARYLAREYRARLALVARGEADVADELEALGGEVLCLRADVAELAQMEAVVAQVHARFGPIQGVIHAAGVAGGGPVGGLTAERLREVLRPKVLGTGVLDRVTRDEPLDFFALFSSLAAHLAPPGQGAYVAANAFQEAYALRRAAAGRATLAVSWGPWERTGLAAGDGLVAELEASGVGPLATSEAVEAFARALASGQSRLAVARLDLGRLGRLLEPSVAVEGPAEAPVEGGDGRPEIAARLEELLTGELAAALRLERALIDPETPFGELGLDSVRGVAIGRSIGERFGVAFKPEALFRYPTVRALAGYLAELPSAPFAALLQERDDRPRPDERVASMPRIEPAVGPPGTSNEDAIAVIGLACRFPGAESPAAFWAKLRAGAHAISEVPRERWDPAEHFSPDPGVPGRSYSRWGGFIEDVDRFDPLFFHLSPRDARLMDPQQRIFLEVASEALEDAAYAGPGSARCSTGVFVGASPGEYGELLAGRLGDISDPGVGTALALSIVANRVSYCLDLDGPSLTIDTACSSALVAVHQACQALLRGECDMALAGGVNLMLTATTYLVLSKARVLAPDDRCKAFAAAADGYVRGEGAGAVVLKPLRRALADGDHIRAVIRGSAVNQDGRTSGISAPNPRAQTEVVCRAWERAGIDPATISLIEAHGSGTSLGDPIEVGALAEAFGRSTRRAGWCALGTVKSNIGHLEPAAGIAGLIKVILALEARQLPPTLHFDAPNALIDFAGSPFYVNERARRWESEGGGPRRAGVSSLGFGGTNCHVVVEEAPPAAARAPADDAGLQVLALSARTPAALGRLAERFRAVLESDEAPELADVCFSANTGRKVWGQRLAVVGRDRAAVVTALRESGRARERESERARERGSGGAGAGRRWVVDVGPVAGEAARARAALRAWGVPGEAIVEDSAGLAAETVVVSLAEPGGLPLRDRLVVAAARVWELGANVDWEAFHRERPGRRVSLPTYPFERKRYWVDGGRPSDGREGSAPLDGGLAVAEDGLSRTWGVAWVARPLDPEAGNRWAPGGRWLVLGPGLERLGGPLVEALRAVGQDPLPLAGPASTSRQALGELLRRLPVGAEFPVGAIFVDSEEGAGSEEDLEAFEAEYRARVEPLFDLAQALAEAARPRPSWDGEFSLWVATSGGEASPIASAVRGLGRVLPHEIRSVAAHLVDLGQGSAEARIGRLVREIGVAPPGEVSYEGEERRERVLVPCRVGRSAEGVRPGDVWLITGGGSGIGAELALDLAGRARVRLALLGRSPRAAREPLIARLEALGSEVLYLEADAGCPEQMAAALARVRARWGRLTVVVHGAGVFDNRTYSLANKDVEGFRAVQAPKVRGAWLLERLLRDDPPELVVLLSSIAAVAGPLGSGLADYAAANAFLDGCARAWDGRGGTRWVAIDWSLWDGVGMGGGATGRGRALEALGLRPLRKEDALAVLRGIVAEPTGPRVAVLEADAARFRPELLLATIGSGTAEQRSPRPPDADRRGPTNGPRPAGGSAVVGASAATVDFLREQLVRLLRVERDEIELDVSLADYGLDSLTIADLVGAIEARYGRAINHAVLLENPTLRGLAAYLDASYGSSNGLREAAPAGGERVDTVNGAADAGASGPPELRILKALERGEIGERDALEQLTALAGAES